MFIVIDIGCLECEVPTKIVGVFYFRAMAEEVAARCEEKLGKTGRNSFKVFELEGFNVVGLEYAEAVGRR